MNKRLESFPPGSFLRDVSANGFHYSKMLPIPEGYDRIMAYPRIGTPLGCDENLERCLKLTGKFVPDYHLAPYMEIYTRPQLQRKFEDMKQMEFIAVPEQAFQQSGSIDPVVQARNDSRFLSDLLLYPVHLKLRNTPFIPNQDILMEIKRRYSPVAQVEGYMIARRKPETPPQ